MAPPPPPPDVDALLSQIGWVRNLARTLVGDVHADDLAQDTILRALEAPPRHGTNVRGWLATIARNLSRANYRSDQRRKKRHDKVARPDEAPTPDQLFAVAEASRLLQDAVNELDEDYRYLILLRFFSGQSPAEIAEAQNTTSNAIRSKLSRATAKLGELLRRKYGDQAMVPCLILMVPVAGPGGAVSTATATGIGLGWLLSWQAMTAALLMMVAAILFWPDSNSATGSRNDQLAVGGADSGTHVQEPARPNDSSGRQPVAPTDGNEHQTTVVVRTIDQAGLPIANAQVVAWPAQTAAALPRLFLNEREANHPLAVMLTDAEGIALVPLMPETPVMILAGARMGAMAMQRLTTPAAGERLDSDALTLDASGCIEGRVNDLGGLPVADARVMLESAGGTSFHLQNSFHRTFTAADGSFEFFGIPAGDYRLLVLHPQFLPEQEPEVAVVTGRSTDLRLELDPGVQLSGHILSEEGQALPGARVWSVPPADLVRSSYANRPPGQQPVSFSDQNGEVHLQGISEEGTSSLVVTATGFQSQTLTAIDPSLPFEVRLQRSLDWTLLLTDASSRPVTGAQVHLVHHAPAGSAERRRLVTGPDGRAVFDRLCKGSYEVYVMHEQGTLHIPSFDLTHTGAHQERTLSAGARLELRVHDAAGKPVPGVMVRMVALEDPAADGGPTLRTSFPPVTRRMDGHGVFATAAFPGRWQVFLLGPNVATQDFEVTLAEARTVSREIQIDVPASLSFDLRDAQGAPLTGLRMALLPIDRDVDLPEVFSPLHNSDDQGRLQIQKITPGRYALFPWSGRRPKTVPADAFLFSLAPGEQRDQIVQLGAVSQTELEISRNGQPLQGARLALTWREDVAPGQSPARMRVPASNREGLAALPPMRAGSYFLMVQVNPEEPMQKVAVQLPAGVAKVDVALAGAGLKGRLLNFEGSPLSASQVILEPLSAEAGAAIDPEQSAVVSTDGRGAFHFLFVPAGQWRLRALDTGVANPIVPLLSTDGQLAQDLGDLHPAQACSVTGSVPVSEMTSALPGFVRAEHLGLGLLRRLPLTADGRFQANDLDPGMWRFSFQNLTPVERHISADSTVEIGLK